MVPNLEILCAPSENIDGQFPRKWGDWRAIKMVNLAGNHLKGEILSVLNNCQKLHFLDVSSNKIVGLPYEKLCIQMLYPKSNLY